MESKNKHIITIETSYNGLCFLAHILEIFRTASLAGKIKHKITISMPNNDKKEMFQSTFNPDEQKITNIKYDDLSFKEWFS